MKKMNCPLFFLLTTALLLLQAGCQGPADGIQLEEMPYVDESAGESACDLEEELRDICRELELEKARLDLVIKKKHCLMTEAKISRAATEAELELVERRLAAFGAHTSQLQLSELDLELLTLRDEHKQSTEELKQLEMMYAESELEDKTSEIVLEQGRRRRELTAADLANMERKRAAAFEYALPMERAEIEHEVAALRAEIRLAGLQADLAIAEIELAFLEHQTSILDLEARKTQIEKEPGIAPEPGKGKDS